MRRSQKGKYAGIVKVLIGDGPDHAGMGILIDPRHVITCAHVVSAALGGDVTTAAHPTEPVHLTFPMLAEPILVSATVVEWRGPGMTPQSDIAVLRLDEEAPKAAGIAILADLTGMSPDGDELSVFGSQEGRQLGNHIDARFKGSTSAAWVQVDGVNRTNPFIQPGYSGAAVWDQKHEAVLGMVVAKWISDDEQIAYMIPTVDLRDCWPWLRIEHRPLPASFARTWTVLSTFYFFLILAHWAWDRGAQIFAPVTLAPGQQQLAAFWGMHIYAFFTPFILAMLIAFARAFRLHHWVRRIPSFGEVRMAVTPSSTWRTAGMSLLAFIILPLAAQIHFIGQFHDYGRIYIDPSRFGYETNTLKAQGETCYETGTILCTKKEAGRYALATSARGTMANHWNNAYHYGDRDGGRGSTVTFFPIAQPAAILFLTGISVLLGTIALFLVFKRPANQLARDDGSAVSSKPYQSLD